MYYVHEYLTFSCLTRYFMLSLERFREKVYENALKYQRVYVVFRENLKIVFNMIGIVHIGIVPI